ncbi:hypothetical protein TRVA0_014S01750 [Trichomonascus vanleenenianus]|uniref:PAS domain-containing hybrid sensor histidine kinase/response regulator n=1 Tax=Trichomonascus vanleenenianus TaxID=2268995 RepID=UPI003ECAA335
MSKRERMAANLNITLPSLNSKRSNGSLRGFSDPKTGSTNASRGTASTNSSLMAAIVDSGLGEVSSSSAAAEDIYVPDLNELIIQLNRDCGFSALLNNVIDIFETHFGGQRLSIAVPRDATDIINIPWGLKALWNKNEPIRNEPLFSVGGGGHDFGSPSNLHQDDDESSSWDTDVDDENDVSADGSSLDGHLKVASTPDAKLSGSPVFADDASISSATRTTPQPSSSFKQKFSLGRKLSFSTKYRKSSIGDSEHSTPVQSPKVHSPKCHSSTNLAATKRRLSASPANTATTTTTNTTNTATNTNTTASAAKPRTQQKSSSATTHRRIFNNIRTLEWERDPLIDVEGVVNVLDSDQMVLLQRKYSSDDGIPVDHRDLAAFYLDTEQAPVSPWSQSPAPSPAIIRETKEENPFFSGGAEMERAFDDPNPHSIPTHPLPVDAIGFENTYSIIHIMIIVPNKPSDVAQRSAPLAILSIMSSLIPFPSKLRGIIESLAPHISNAYVQACAHSNLVALVNSNDQRARRRIRNSTSYMSPLKRFESNSPNNDSSTSMLDYPAIVNNFNHGVDVIDNEKSDYSFLHRHKLSDKRRFTLRKKHRVRPHIRRLLHSYGASFMPEPERSSSFATSPQARMSPPKSITTADDDSESNLSARNSGESNQLKRRISAPTGFEMPTPSNRLLRTMLDAIPVHVYVAEPTNGQVTWVSNRTLAFRGQTAEEFIRDPCASIHPDDLTDYLTAWNSALEKGEPLARMVQVRRFDGRYRAFFMRAVPLRDEKGLTTHWFCTLMDIHTQHQAELRAIQLAHETAGDQKYKSLAESTPIIVFTTHPSKGMLYANNKWFEYSGRSPTETYGFQYVNAVHPDDRAKGVLPLTSAGVPDIEQFVGKESKNGVYSVELRLLNKEGEYRWHLVTFTCSDLEKPAESVWFGTCTDIHDQKLIQQKLKEAKDAAQRTIESKTRFLSNMSHEIRTPLIGISGMVGFLLDTPLTEEQLDYCHTISSSSEALLMVINDILDLSKVESGKMKLNYSWFHVRRLVEEANELLSAMAISKNLELNYVIEGDVPPWVKGDRVRLRQVMLNIIGNAIKFTDEGEIFTLCKIRQPLEDQSAIMLEFTVHDTGRGFTEEDSKRMFQPFSQVHGTLPQHEQSNVPHSGAGTTGTGLGLVISRQLIELHGGQLIAHGVKNKGSTFTFTCKVKLPTEEDKPSQEELAKAKGTGDGIDSQRSKIATDLRIMVVCPFQYACQSISHHILATVADPSKCEIKPVQSAEDLITEFAEDTLERKWTHVVISLTDLKKVVGLVQYMFEKQKDVQVIVLTTPVQRSKILKRVPMKDKDGHKITFLPKPLKPSRYSVVFDPSRLREESHDMKMMNAKQTLETHRSVFDELSRFAYGKGYRILLAEDNLVNQKVVGKFLAKAGLKCDVAADGEVCTTKFFDKGVGYYNMILCDLDMPRKDGFGVCTEIRKWEKEMNVNPETPIVALSAYVMSDMSDRCDEVGFTRYISKPVEFGNLKDIIIEILTAVEAQ